MKKLFQLKTDLLISLNPLLAKPHQAEELQGRILTVGGWRLQAPVRDQCEPPPEWKACVAAQPFSCTNRQRASWQDSMVESLLGFSD